MTPRRITVFGGSGFIGRALAQRLAEAGCLLRVAVRDADAAGALKPLGDVGQITPIAASLTRPETLAAAVQGADAVINLTGILYEKGSQSFDAVHHRGAANLARAAREAGARLFVQMSALGADLASPSRYARSKAAGEQAVREIFPEAILFRPSVVFGPRDDFFNRFARMTSVSPGLPLIGGGHTRFQPVYVDDVALAIRRALTDNAARGGLYELGGPAVYTLRQVMEMVLELTGRHRGLVPLPFPLASVMGSMMQLLPVPLLTRDQVILLRRDNILTGGHPGLQALGVPPTTVESVLPAYMAAYRKGGRFAPAQPV